MFITAVNNNLNKYMLFHRFTYINVLTLPVNLFPLAQQKQNTIPQQVLLYSKQVFQHLIYSLGKHATRTSKKQPL